jgi:hypothetical protein
MAHDFDEIPPTARARAQQARRARERTLKEVKELFGLVDPPTTRTRAEAQRARRARERAQGMIKDPATARRSRKEAQQARRRREAIERRAREDQFWREVEEQPTWQEIFGPRLAHLSRADQAMWQAAYTTWQVEGIGDPPPIPRENLYGKDPRSGASHGST